VFDSTGRLVARVGKVGVGPGEITPVRWVVAGRDDTVRVFANTRINIFAGRDFRYVRSTIERSQETGSQYVVLLPGGRTARLSGRLPASGDLNPIYLRDRTGTLIRQLSPTTSPSRPTRLLASAEATSVGSLWVAEGSILRSDGYSVLLVDTLGAARRIYRLTPTWWESVQSFGPMRMIASGADTLSRPLPWLRSLREDSRGRLHVLTRIAKRDWQNVRLDEENQEGNYTSLLEIIDPRAGRLVASVRVVGAPVAVVGDDRFVTYREDRDGYPHIDVWRVRIP
jgi:hypothetical protein